MENEDIKKRELLEDGIHIDLLVTTLESGEKIYDLKIKNLIVHLMCLSEEEARQLHFELDFSCVAVEKEN